MPTWLPIAANPTPAEIAEATSHAPEARRELVEGMKSNHGNFVAAKELFFDIAGTANQVTTQCHIAECRTLVVALDFSEIVDYADPYEGRDRDASVLQGMMLSRVAVDLIREGNDLFTLLPGTAREILNYLAPAIRQTSVALQKLDQSSVEVPIDQLRAILEEIAPVTKPRERVAAVVLELLASPSFVDIASLPLEALALKPKASRDAWMRELNRRRPDRSLSNSVDAVNISTILAINDAIEKAPHVQRPRYVFQLLTRTGVLHSIAGLPETSGELRVRQAIEGWWCDLLLKPAAFVLWKSIERQSPNDSDIQFDAASGVEELSSEIATKLRTLARRTRSVTRVEENEAENARHLLHTLEQLRQSMRKSAYGHIESFRRLVEADVEFSSQLLSDPKRLQSYARAEARKVVELSADVRRDMIGAAAMRTQDMLVRAYEAVRRMYGGLPLDAVIAPGVVGGSRRRWGETLTTLLSGLKLYMNHPIPGSLTWIVPRKDTHPKADPSDDIESRALFGVTVYDDGATTMFWTTRRTIPEILTNLDESMPPGLGGVIAIGTQDAMDVALAPVGSLFDVLIKMNLGPLRGIQLHWEHQCFTWEAPRISLVHSRAAFCSVRGSRIDERTDFGEWLRKLRRSLPIELEEAFQVLKWGGHV